MSRRGKTPETKKSFIKIISKGILVRNSPDKSALITCALQENQIQQVFEQSTIDDTIWFKVNCGWICSRDNAGFICSEPIGEAQAHKFWATEFTVRKRLSSAVANLFTRSHALQNARKSSRGLLKLAQEHVKNQSPLLNLPDINIESLIISLNSSSSLKYREIFEFVKIAASYQSDPYKSLIDIATEIVQTLEMRPSQWVKEDRGVLQTYDVAARNDRFIMAAGQNNIKAFEKFLAEGQELASMHTELKYTALHAAADFGAEDTLKWLIQSGVSLNLRDGRLGQTPLHYAASSGRTSIVSLLLDGGADRTITDYRGQLPYEIAEEHGYYEVKECLKLVAPAILHLVVLKSSPYSIR